MAMERKHLTLLRRRRALATAAGATVLGACSVGPSTGTPKPPEAAAAPVAGQVSWLVRNTAFEVEWERSAISAVKELHPQLDVELLVVPGGEYDAKLTAMAASGTPPEVWTHWGSRSYWDYLKSGWLEDITPLMSRDRIDPAAFLPNTLEWYRGKGRQYALPFLQCYGSFVFYNKALLARAGLKPPPADWNDRSWTWDTMVDYARKLTSAPGTAEATYGLLVFADTAQFLSQTMAQLWGGDIFLPEHYKEGIAPRTQFDSPAAIEAHQARQDLIFRQRVSPTPADREALGVTGDLFQAGKVAMYLHAGWAVRNYTTGIRDFDWAIAAIPPKRQPRGPQFTDAWMLGKQARNKEGGWALIKHLVSPEGQRTMVRLTGSGPALRAAEDEWFKLMSDRMPLADLQKVTEGGARNSVELSAHTFAGWPEIIAAVRKAVDPLWRNEATAADALRSARPGLDAIVAQIFSEFQGTR